MSNLIRYIIQEDPSKKFSIDNIENSKKDYLETYRTKKSNISENWGKKTEVHLNEYMQKNKSNYPGKTRTGLLAPFYDFMKNKKEMEEDATIGNDKFFHCKANYEAAKRGKWGEFVAKTLSTAREFPYGVMKDGIQASSDDWEANRRGWRGAQSGKNLLESCSRNPRDYYK